MVAEHEDKADCFGNSDCIDSHHYPVSLSWVQLWKVNISEILTDLCVKFWNCLHQESGVRLLLLFVGNCKKKNSWTVIRFSTHGELILMGHSKLYAICECLIENLFRVCRPHHHFNCRLQ